VKSLAEIFQVKFLDFGTHSMIGRTLLDRSKQVPFIKDPTVIRGFDETFICSNPPSKKIGYGRCSI
jgi:hypothetical protein